MASKSKRNPATTTGVVSAKTLASIMAAVIAETRASIAGLDPGLGLGPGTEGVNTATTTIIGTTPTTKKGTVMIIEGMRAGVGVLKTMIARKADTAGKNNIMKNMQKEKDCAKILPRSYIFVFSPSRGDQQIATGNSTGRIDRGNLVAGRPAEI